MKAKRWLGAYHIYAIPLFLLIVTALAYLPSLSYPFQFDDCANITKHFNIRHYTLASLVFSGTRWISYWLNSCYYAAVGFSPWLYRVGNLLIHSLNGLLVFLLSYLLLCTTGIAPFFRKYALSLSSLLCALFLLHPVQTQTVSYVIQGQLEGLAALFTLLVLLFFVFYTRATTTAHKTPLFIGLCAAAVLVSGTKEIAIVCPCLALLIDWFFISSGNWKKLKKLLPLHATITTLVWGSYLYLLKPTFFAKALGLQMEAKNNLGNIITKNVGDAITPIDYFISQFKVILHYLWIFLWPFNISVEYDWKLVESFWSSDCIIPLIILGVLGLIIAKGLRTSNNNTWVFGLLWFAICIAPRSTIIPSCELIVDYKTYLASVGWLFLIAAATIKLWEYASTRMPALNRWSQLKPIAACTLLITLSWMTVQRNTIWRTGLEFWGNMIENAPGKPRAYNNYGFELSQTHRKWAESIPYFKKAVSMDKNYRDPYNNLAVAYAALQEVDLAIQTLQQLITMYPHYPEAYNNMGAFLLDKDETEKAQQCFTQAIQLRPHYGKAHFNLGRIYYSKGKYEQAHECFKTSCTQADNDTEFGFSSYAKLSLLLNKHDEAIEGYRKALQFNPNHPEYTFNLANAYYLCGQYTNAELWYKKSFSLEKDDRIDFNLAEIYMKQGEVSRALEHYQQVKLSWEIVPQLPLRIAKCHMQLQQPEKARDILTQLQEKPTIPDQIKRAAQEYLKAVAQA